MLFLNNCAGNIPHLLEPYSSRLDCSFNCSLSLFPNADGGLFLYLVKFWWLSKMADHSGYPFYLNKSILRF